MSAERVNPFASPEAVQPFELKPRVPKPVASEHIEQLARDYNFPSRQAARPPQPAPAATPRRRRTHTTGRNQQLNFKATAATVDRFYAIADQKGIPLCALLEQALDALESKGHAATNQERKI